MFGPIYHAFLGIEVYCERCFARVDLSQQGGERAPDAGSEKIFNGSCPKCGAHLLAIASLHTLSCDYSHEPPGPPTPPAEIW